MRIRRATEFGRGAGEQLRLRGDLGMHFHADDDLPAVDEIVRLCAHDHHRCGLKLPAACSITWPSENRVSSSNGRPINCKPSGRPCASRPAGTEIPGRPAMLTVTVNTSLRYISTGSAPPFSPRPKAADGVAGVSMACTPLAKQSSKSFLISVRTFCARR